MFEFQKFAQKKLFLPTTPRRQFEFPAAQYFIISKQSQSEKHSKLQFLFIRLNKLTNPLPLWDKMAKRSSILKEISAIFKRK